MNHIEYGSFPCPIDLNSDSPESHIHLEKILVERRIIRVFMARVSIVFPPNTPLAIMRLVRSNWLVGYVDIHAEHRLFANLLRYADRWSPFLFNTLECTYSRLHASFIRFGFDNNSLTPMKDDVFSKRIEAAYEEVLTPDFEMRVTPTQQKN